MHMHLYVCVCVCIHIIIYIGLATPPRPSSLQTHAWNTMPPYCNSAGARPIYTFFYYVYIYVYVYLYVYIYRYAYIYIHTYTYRATRWTVPPHSNASHPGHHVVLNCSTMSGTAHTQPLCPSTTRPHTFSTPAVLSR